MTLTVGMVTALQRFFSDLGACDCTKKNLLLSP